MSAFLAIVSLPLMVACVMFLMKADGVYEYVHWSILMVLNSMTFVTALKRYLKEE